MKWFLEMLVNGDLGPMEEKQKSVVTDVYNSNERIIMLVNDLLDVSRMESGKVVLEPTPTNLIDFLKSMLPEVAQNFTKRKQTFDFEKPESLPRISIDPKLIWQALSNLLTNASKYTPDGGRVILKLTLESQDILIQVSDNGYGIPEFQKSRIFEKFFRADNTSKMEGTGLGLYIVKEIIEASGGKIWFESTEGKGTTFSVTLPLSGSKANKITQTL
jgi:signal transduction histidine kinase